MRCVCDVMRGRRGRFLEDRQAMAGVGGEGREGRR